ncbi:hypothetical protein A4X09_0g6252 [Tilletia walkeri]|uniref:Nudix hydrolase domain-containing protein n=1 Tax=Tilletia walkeri TaxID=117179 RepID=A0A8X7T235_9BASI|nr:hypothetical protein A4X09_0g6252 [Tilletia walkeri]
MIRILQPLIRPHRTAAAAAAFLAPHSHPFHTTTRMSNGSRPAGGQGLPRDGSSSKKKSGNRPSDHKSGQAGSPMTPVPSASLVVLCPITLSDNSNTGASAKKVEYTTLMLQRSARLGSSFRSAVVFPGGQLDLADEAPFVPPEAVEGSLLEMDIRNERYMAALRLCAVRETFEESGLLLMPSSASAAGGKGSGGMPLSRAVGYEEAGMDKAEWLAIREQVHNDASHFVPFLHRVWAKLGGRTGEVPIASMTHHSNWVTPGSVVRPAKRFDAHFFLTCLDRPNVFGAGGGAGGSVEEGQTDIGLEVDGNEATSLRLGSPQILLQAAFEDRHLLYPPQAYILADLAAHIDRHQSEGKQAGLPELEPLVFGAGVTRVEEEARGLGGRNYTWDRKSNTSSSARSPGEIDPQSAAWVSKDSPPFSQTPSSYSSSGGQPSIQADLAVLRAGVTAIEPHALLKHGMNVPAGTPPPASDATIGDSDCDTEVFVFPLVLPGDYQASAAQRAAAGTASSAGKDAQLARRPLNRLFVSPRSREDGGGLVVRGAQRVGVGALRDFEVGMALKDVGEEEEGGDDGGHGGQGNKARL